MKQFFNILKQKIKRLKRCSMKNKSNKVIEQILIEENCMHVEGCTAGNLKKNKNYFDYLMYYDNEYYNFVLYKNGKKFFEDRGFL